MSQIVSRLVTTPQQRRDDRELEYQIGSQSDVPEGLNFHPPLMDPQPYDGVIFDGTGIRSVLSLQRMWDDRVRYGGSNNFPYRITGFAQDEAGNALSNCVLSLFRTSDDVWMYDTVTKDGGQYDFGVIDTVTTYYIVAYNAGVNKQGVTVNTLVGS